jgi:glycine oxidase
VRAEILLNEYLSRAQSNARLKMGLKIGIAGAGMIGRMIALLLLRSGHFVHLFDADSRSQSSSSCAFVAGGMLAPYCELPEAGVEIFSLGRHSLGLWPGLISSLSYPVDFRQNGTISIAHNRDNNELIRFESRMRKCLEHENEPSPSVVMLRTDELSRLEPELPNKFGRALLLDKEGSLDPVELMYALELDLLQAGAVWSSASVVTGLYAGLIEIGSASHHFDLVIDCRGFGARKTSLNFEESVAKPYLCTRRRFGFGIP